ncbi:MAG: hypothetical protein WC815_08940 [Vicinamibacterales bacterium]|jgi:hypothetical protein
MTRWLTVAGAAWAVALVSVAGQPGRPSFQGTLDQHPAIDYRWTDPADPVARLQADLAAGAVTLAFDGQQGYLRSLLSALHVPVESQVLLFSKTGVQHAFTNPQNPRALYFNDRVVVGYIPGAPVIEIASHDPRQGVMFYTLRQDAAAVAFARPSACLTCHLSANSMDVPGILVRSMFTGPDGRTMPQLGSFLVDHRSPLKQRWGGWYVVGSHGAARHMGNAMVTDPSNPEAAISEATLNRAVLDAQVAAAAYPIPSSDIAALMVFDHQGHALNLLTRLGWETRIAMAESRLDFAGGELRELVNETADYLLFVDEARLDAPVRASSAFATVFAAAGTRDSLGRSLRDFDLATRLFRYRCSYMIQSPAFDGLPAEARAALVARLRAILSGGVADPRYTSFTAGEREAVLAIVRETVKGWS